MQSAIISQQYVNMPLSELNIKGDVTLNQVSPLHCNRKNYNTHYNYSIINNLNDINSYRTSEIIEGYSKRNSMYMITNKNKIGNIKTVYFSIYIFDKCIYKHCSKARL